MADRPHLLGRLRLDADLIEADAERAGEALAHRRDVRAETRRLRDHGRVDVADLPAGAAALGDIGHHFPDTDMQYQGADSLALPVGDTLKRAEGDRAVATLPRDHIWQAQTPQMFRFGVLADALARSPEATDEASAVEAVGLRPKLVTGSPENIKVTHPDDFAIAEALLSRRAPAKPLQVPTGQSA